MLNLKRLREAIRENGHKNGHEKSPSAEKAEGRISFTSEIQVMHTQNVLDFAFY